MAKPGPRPAPPTVQKLRKTAPSRMSGPPVAKVVGQGRPRVLLPVKPPKHLREEAAECWKHITTLQKAVADGGMDPWIGEPERQLVEVACVAYRQWRYALRVVDQTFDFARSPKSRENRKGTSDEMAALLVAKRTKGGTVVDIGAPHFLLERSQKMVLSAFNTLGLSKQFPTMVAQIETETSSGDKLAARLLA